MISSLLANRFIWRLGDTIEKGQWGYVYKEYRRKYEVAESFEFKGPHISLMGDGRIVLGADSYVGFGSVLSAPKGTVLKIGKSCRLSYYVVVFTANFASKSNFNLGEPSLVTGDVEIGDGCLLGTGCFVKQGVTIGEDVHVGANSVVTHNLPPHCVAAGAPAKIIRYKERVKEKQQEENVN